MAPATAQIVRASVSVIWVWANCWRCGKHLCKATTSTKITAEAMATSTVQIQCPDTKCKVMNYLAA